MADKELALMAHLMRRAGFGATRDELEERVAKGYEATVEELVDPETFGVPSVDRDLLFRYYPSIEIPSSPGNGKSNLAYYLVATKRPLEEKMAFFWHSVFATGNSKVDNPTELVRQIDMFRERGLGNYRTLLVELAKNPAMLFWLDNNESHKDAPNENWGRELLELFSMGVGNYSEQDVFECSRAFTGWTVSRKIPRFPYGRFYWSFEYNPGDHDDSEKVFLGHQGPFNGEDIIDIVVKQPATARFIARHLYNFFVADESQVPAWQHTPPRDPAAIDMIADAFTSSGYDMRSTMRVLFNSQFFKNEDVWWAKVKSPVELVIGTLRLVGDWATPRPGLQAVADDCEYMGQELLNPPSVEGWHTGTEWIDSGALVSRINYAADRLSNIDLPGIQSIINRIRVQGATSPANLVDSCLDLIGPLDVAEKTRTEMMSVAEHDGEVRWDTDEASTSSAQRVGAMLALIAASREFQFA